MNGGRFDPRRGNDPRGGNWPEEQAPAPYPVADPATAPYQGGWNSRPQPPYAAYPYSSRPIGASPPVPSTMAGYAPDGYARWGGDPGWDGADSDQPERRPTVTPFRVVMLIALIASAFVASYGLFIARASQVIPITVAALAVFAIAAALLGINVGASSLSSARSGRLGRSIIGALVGGILCLMAAGAGAAAIMMGLLAGPLN